MMDAKSFASAMAQISEERGIAPAKIIETIESALAAAYKKEYGKKGQTIKCSFNPDTSQTKFWQVLLVLDESMIYTQDELAVLKEKEPSFEVPESERADEKKFRFNPEKHIMVKEARKINPKIKAGQNLEIPLQAKEDFGRIAAQTAKQVILQKIKETERDSIFEEYKTKEGEIVSGIVQRVEGRNVYMDLGKTTGLMTKEEQIPGEFYRPGARLKVYVLNVENTQKGPIIFLSRAYPKLISKLFELEAPEVASGAVLIKSIAREPGSRTKIAVTSTVEGVDPIGSVVGQRGARVQTVIQELGGEKIDIVEWSQDPEKYIANSLSPAKALEVKIMPKNKARVLMPEDQLSLAIGKDGQNVRLAAKLTGWKIDVRAPGKENDEKDEDEETGENEEKEKEEKLTKKDKKNKIKT